MVAQRNHNQTNSSGRGKQHEDFAELGVWIKRWWKAETADQNQAIVSSSIAWRTAGLCQQQSEACATDDVR